MRANPDEDRTHGFFVACFDRHEREQGSKAPTAEGFVHVEDRARARDGGMHGPFLPLPSVRLPRRRLYHAELCSAELAADER